MTNRGKNTYHIADLAGKKESALSEAGNGGIKLDIHELNQLIHWARIFIQITLISMIISIFAGMIALLKLLG